MNIYIVINYSDEDIFPVAYGTAVEEICADYRQNGIDHRVVPLAFEEAKDACEFCIEWHDHWKDFSNRVLKKEKGNSFEERIEWAEDFYEQRTLEAVKGRSDSWDCS